MRHPIKLALIGFGKIANDQHLPAIAANSNFELSCIIDPRSPSSDLPVFDTLDDAVSHGVEITAIIICTPPVARLAIVERAIHFGFDIMLEKPPASTLSDAEMIERRVADSSQIAFATWHSRYAGMVGFAQDWLRSHKLKRAKIVWHEDVQIWHPNQPWLWRDGGFGVFDMGINALSILTMIHPSSYNVIDAQLAIPENATMPATAELVLNAASDARVDVSMSFLAKETETWTIELLADNGETVSLFDGGAGCIDAQGVARSEPNLEYANIYQRFAQLIEDRESDIDIQPLAIVEQALTLGKRSQIGSLTF